MLEKRGAVIETAVKLSRIMRERSIDGAVIGGVAVVLHGHVRTTKDVDLFVRQPLTEVSTALEAAGLSFDPSKREFLCDGVPVHLVPEQMLAHAPTRFEVRDDVTTVSLADLISMKLHSGTTKLVRAQDLADVIGLIKALNLSSAFARHIDRPMRAEFKKLVNAVKRS